MRTDGRCKRRLMSPRCFRARFLELAAGGVKRLVQRELQLFVVLTRYGELRAGDTEGDVH